MKAFIVVALILLFSVNCKKATKEIVDALFKPYFKDPVPANFTTLYKNIQSPFPKYTFGILDETSLGTTITTLGLKDKELTQVIYFFEEAKQVEDHVYSKFDCIGDKEKKGGTCSGLYGASLTKEGTTYYFVAKYENLTFEYNQYKTEKTRVCKKPRKCKYEDVKVPVAGYTFTDVLLLGIKNYVLTQVYGDIIKHL